MRRAEKCLDLAPQLSWIHVDWSGALDDPEVELAAIDAYSRSTAPG